MMHIRLPKENICQLSTRPTVSEALGDSSPDRLHALLHCFTGVFAPHDPVKKPQAQQYVLHSHKTQSISRARQKR